VPVRSPILRLSDIIEAVERIRSVLGDMHTLRTLEKKVEPGA
jgi:hypothetical protein